jgi:multidrug efflux pump subunit AcrA (membrane-fusion protein)
VEHTLLSAEKSVLDAPLVRAACTKGSQVACDWVAAHREAYDRSLAWNEKNDREQEAAARERERRAKESATQQAAANSQTNSAIDTVIAGVTAELARSGRRPVASADGQLDGKERVLDIKLADGQPYWVVCVAGETGRFQASITSEGSDPIAFETSPVVVPHTFTQSVHFEADAAHLRARIAIKTGWFGAPQRVACRVFSK